MAEEKLFPGRPWSPSLGKVADGVWLLRGDIRGGMNIYFIEDEGGLVQFDAGTKPMAKAVRAVEEKLGPIKRVVLGHSHTDHRGTAPSSDAPVFCHPDEVTYAERDEWPDYWHMEKLPVAWVRLIYPTLHRRWDAGGVKIAGTVEEGDEVAGFKVHHFPGHAPGLIGLFRESDRLALCTDTVYFIDSTRPPGLQLGSRGGKGLGAQAGRTRAGEGLCRTRDAARGTGGRRGAGAGGGEVLAASAGGARSRSRGSCRPDRRRTRHRRGRN
jgi:glyoxylase-like metal-dependent hydrolase (beta-lactamase superfamily II)